MDDEHIMEALGMASIFIKDRKVVDVSEPKLHYCPLFNKHRNIEHIDKKTIWNNIQKRIDEFGLFSEQRELELDSFVGFGTSEIFMSSLNHGLLDAVVSVCDGAGTVITSNPKLVQGIGARISGLVRTSPIPGLISRIVDAGGVVLEADKATINQYEGVKLAKMMGHSRVGVSIVSPSEASRCKALQEEGFQVVTFLVHTSGVVISEEELADIDLATACASKLLRNILQGRVLLQAGRSIPIFALTQIGKELVLERAKDNTTPLLIHSQKLPSCEGKQPQPLI